MPPTVILVNMVTEKISDTYHVIHFDNGNVIHLVGTAHVSNQSVEEVRSIIEEQHPDRVCIELDDGRMKSKTRENSWENMDIKKIFEIVCKAVALAMGIAVVVLSAATDLEVNTAISLLGIGMACAGLALMSK